MNKPLNQRKPKIKKRAVSVAELMKTNHKPLDFSGPFFDLMGKPQKTGSILIWGPSGNGKTRLAIQLAKYLCNFGRVGYNALEEGTSLSLQKSFIAEGMQEVKRRIVIYDKEPISEIIKRLEQHKSPDFVFIDSLQYAGLNYKQYQLLIERFRNKLFVFTSHADGKHPAGSVAKSVRYDAHVKIWVEGYKAFAASRYGGGKEYVIWQHGANEAWSDDLMLKN